MRKLKIVIEALVMLLLGLKIICKFGVILIYEVIGNSTNSSRLV
ncbi:MAG: hypothetical protein ACK6CP_08870 [Pseudanabaena sp.]